MDKEDVVQIHNGILLSHKSEWNDAIYSNMNEPRYYTKWSQKKTNTTWYHLHMESKIWHKRAYVQGRNRLTESRRVVAKGEEECGRVGGGSGLADVH